MNDEEKEFLKRAEAAEEKVRELQSEIENFGKEPLETTPKNLVPRLDEHQSTTAYYRTATITHKDGDVANMQEIGAPVEIAGMFGESWKGLKVGFEKPHSGVLLTHEQAWQAKGISLGNLLHSLTLAPGEATRVAIQDWSSVKQGKSQEDTTQQEQAASSDTQNRALDEIQSATAREALSGSSQNSANAVSASAGMSLLFFSAGASTTNTWATSVNTSKGDKESDAKESQRIQQATQQAAESARTRRASVVRETSQSDTSKTTTRIVANYNHMHALTMMYYEVLEVYSVTTKVIEKKPCVFIPMQILTGEQLVTHYPLIMAKAAGIAGMDILEAAIRTKTSQFYSSSNSPKFIRLVEEAKVAITTLDWLSPNNSALLRALIEDDSSKFASMRTKHLTIIKTISENIHAAEVSLNKIGVVSALSIDELYTAIQSLVAAIKSLDAALGGAPGQENTISSIGGSYIYIGSVDYFKNIKFSLDGQNKIKAYSKEGIEKNNLAVYCVRQIITKLYQAIVFARGVGVMQTEVGGMIDSFREYFNQAVWFEALTPTVVHTMFKGKLFDGKPLNSIIDPKPVAVTGNLIGFVRTDIEEKPKTSDSPPPKKTVVIPTGGVFAEAVLGESVAAERIDLGRFWNWQDSPIPLTPTEISPISTSHQATDMDFNAKDFSDFQAKLRTLSGLPNPEGLGAMLNAMAAGNMFKDMSGSEIAKEMANAVAQYASQGEQNAQKVASSNLQKTLDVGGALGGKLIDAGGTLGAAALTGGATVITEGFKGSSTVLGGLIKEPGVANKLLGIETPQKSPTAEPTPPAEKPKEQTTKKK